VWGGVVAKTVFGGGNDPDGQSGTGCLRGSLVAGMGGNGVAFKDGFVIGAMIGQILAYSFVGSVGIDGEFCWF
jgi:hypothetical protein